MLPTLEAGSIDAVVCDPPYHLTSVVERFGKENSAPVIVPEGGSGVYARSTRGFMGQQWDGGDVAFRPETWREVLRVLKPGGYLLAFSGTRTYHRMTVAIEDAGFEIRDCLSWQYGSGFPKSLSVSRSIEGMKRGRGARYSASDPNLSVESGTLSAPGNQWQDASARTMANGEQAWTGGKVNVTDPEALAWGGWGTALKPAWEPVVVARRPLIGTVAGNVLKYGTGAMNIDGCRVESGGEHMRPFQPTNNAREVYKKQVGFQPTNHHGGRWPANVILSHGPDCGENGCAPGCPVAAMDAQSGGDGASRYFNNLPIEADDLVPFIYAAKASRGEREEGCGDLPVRGSEDGKVRNHHPTVKPVAVMRHLVRLVTRKGGVVLDPFMGSGSTGIAAVTEGMRFVGIEMSEDYLAIARARIGAAQGDGFAKTAPPPLTVFRTAYAPPPLTGDNGAAMMSSPPTARKEAPVVYVKNIESNVKKGAKTELGRLTLIIGPNGSGKSSVVNAVELALNGRASDVVGRTEVAKGIDLLALAPADADALWSKATLSDGRAVEWRCERNAKTGGAREATTTLPADLKPSFPVRQVREALSGAPATVRAWLVGRIGASVSEATVMGLIPEDLHAAYIDLCRPLFGYPAQILLDAREAAGKQSRNASSDAKAATSLAEQIGATLGAEPTDDEMERARQRVREAAVAASAATAPTVRPNVAALRGYAEAKVQAYAEIDAEVTRLTVADNHVIAQPNAEVARVRDALTQMLVFHAAKDAAECLVCASPIPHGAHGLMFQRAEALANAAKGDVTVLENRERRARLTAALPEAQRLAEEAVHRFRIAVAEDERIAALPAPHPDPLSALRAAEEQVRALEGSRAAWQNVRAAKARARDLTARQRLYTDLHAAIEDAIGGVLERARTAFVAKVQSYLPTEDAFDLVLSANGKDVCQFGFVRDGALHTALSGAEWARLTLALAAAVTDDDEANLSILTPEDRAFDAETLAAVMRALGNAPGQVILCSPVAPAGRTPKGWTVIDLSAPKATKAKKGDDAGFDAVGEAK